MTNVNDLLRDYVALTISAFGILPTQEDTTKSRFRHFKVRNVG